MNLRAPTLELIKMAKSILNGSPMDLREIYYEAEARQFITGGLDDYNRLKYALGKARKYLLIDPGLIEVPRDRQTMSSTPNSYTAKQIIESARYAYSLYSKDFWKDQENYIEVWVEKISLCKYFLPYCREYSVLLIPCKGDQAISAIWEAKQRFERKLTMDKNVKVLYFGDFNPSGVHAPIAIQNTLRGWGQTDVEFNRIALMFEDIEKYNLPPNPTKKTTKKDKTLADLFIKKYGEDYNVELDSLKAHNKQEFLRRIEDSIKAEIDFDLKEETDKKIEKVQARLKKILAKKLRWN